MLQEKVIHIIPDEFPRCPEPAALFSEGQPQDQLASATPRSDPDRKKDSTILEHINQALWKNDVLRATDLNEIDIRVKNGDVYLSGHLLSSTNRDRVEQALRTVSDIRSVRSALVLDDDLLSEVAVSLSALEQTSHCKFLTGVSHGVIVLNGEVSSSALRSSAEICAASQPGVRGVINYLRVPGEVPPTGDRRFLQPAIGEEICFLDGISGIVRQVVINPDNLRVTAMVIQGRFFDSRKSLGESSISSIQPVEERWLIPMDLVGVLTTSSGFLTIASTDFAKFRKFDASEFVTPGLAADSASPRPNWIPPYPYCPADVLFQHNSARFIQQGIDAKEH